MLPGPIVIVAGQASFVSGGGGDGGGVTPPLVVPELQALRARTVRHKPSKLRIPETLNQIARQLREKAVTHPLTISPAVGKLHKPSQPRWRNW